MATASALRGDCFRQRVVLAAWSAAVALALCGCHAFTAGLHTASSERKLAEGDIAGALEEAQKAVSDYPSWLSYLRRAEAYKAAGDWDAAEADYERVLAAAPDNRDARAALDDIARRRPAAASAGTPLDVRTVDLATVKYPLPDPELTQDDIQVVDVAFGDLDGDGREEVVVLLSWNYGRFGGMGWGHLCYVFSGASGKLVQLAELDAGSKSADILVKDVEVSGGELRVSRCEAVGESEYLASVAYRLNGQRFVELSKRRTPTVNCWFGS